MASSKDGRDHAKARVGSALVVGAGIAGMQSAIDLAEAGIKVCLLDRSPAIGGTMAQLDKTFPTNDCAMCIMSPKLVEVGRHLNIELINCAEVEGISGEPGDFTVTVRQHPRYVDLLKCTGCGDCAGVCPITLPDEFNGGLSERKAIYKLYPQAIPNAFAIDKLGVAPCREACPIHQRAQGYLALVAEGRYADAYRTILEDNPFPSICGRVCNHRCEEACNRGQLDEPVNIMALKRFVADWAWEHPDETLDALSKSTNGSSTNTSCEQIVGKKVAVVGAGPAGLTCAQDLVRFGCQVTVYEALPVPGGMLRVGIPSYRLPVEVVQREIDNILAQGIDLKLNHRVEHIDELLKDFDAVFVGVGAHAGVKLPIPGNDLPDVILATDFLRSVSLINLSPNEAEGGGKELPLIDENMNSRISGRGVLVLGGGNVAIDAAMTALRLGASWVGMTCLEGREQMPAHEWEIRDAEDEGIEIFPSRTFKEITSEDRQVTGIRTAKVNFRGFVDGRPDFDEIPDSEEMLPADVVIFAIGQRPETDCLKQVNRLGNGRVEVDPETLATNVPGIFAGGDAVTGTAFVVDAIAAGHKAAESIRAFLGDEKPSNLKWSPERVVKLNPVEISQRFAAFEVSDKPRFNVKKQPASDRCSNFTEIALGLNEEQAREEALRCLRCGICSECNQCVYACRAGAIQHQDEERLIQLNVGAIVLAPGLEPIPGDVRPEYGYGRYPNVITSVQFERMLSAAGPFSGEVKRPSDKTHPKKVAWIQCVGSRDCSSWSVSGEHASYCSSVCCMYATKEAIIAKEHDANIEPTIFYIDVRSFGKGFEPYIERAKNEHGIRYVRCMVSSVNEVPNNNNLRLSYVTFEGDDGRKPVLHEEEFDLVVLSVGLRPTADTRAMAKRIGVNLNELGFVDVPTYKPVRTSRPGVFIAGAFAEPKDIPESVVEASCAAAQVSEILSEVRGTQTRVPEYPPERDISEEAERVGVFICHCGINIGSVVNVPEVVEFARTLPGVAYAEHNLYTCSQDTQLRISQVIQEQGLNRVVVASCTPRTHEPLFQDTLRQAGLNPHLFEMANIREQDSWVHRATPDVATEKAKQLAAMAVAKARKLRSIYRNTFAVDKRALVIGGGLAGMTAALSISRQGFEVYLVERESELGGNLKHIYVGSKPGEDPQHLLRETVSAVLGDSRITIFSDSEVTGISGYTGQFRSSIRQSGGAEIELQHGVIILATGAREMTPKEYLYGHHRRVITQRELEERLVDPLFLEDASRSTIVMIQCVGSRDREHPYCSRICCTQALKNALRIKEKSPDSRVVVLYRDLRSYGFREQLYRQARQAGVIFLEYNEAMKPEVIAEGDGRIKVNVRTQPDGTLVELVANWVVLSAGIEPEPGNAALAQLLKVPLDETGFFLEAHVKLRPVDFAAEGVFLAGLAHSPRGIEETIIQAKAAAVRAVALLAKDQLEATPIVASVNPRLCAACGVCVEVCPYGARRLDPGMPYAEVIEVLCQGCGACVVACPNKASQQKGFEFVQVFDMIDAACA